VRAVDRRGHASASRAVTVIVPQREPAGVPAGGEPVGISTANGLVWVSNGSSGTVSAIDPAVKRNVSTFRAGGQLGGIVAAVDAVWVSDFGGAKDVDALADTPSGLWVSTFAGIAAVVDPNRRVVVRRVTLPSRGSGVAYAGGSVWVSAYDSSLVVRLDPATGALLGAVHTGPEPRESVAAGGALWVANQLNGTVTPVPLR
jgi:streptogramin lyase